MTHRLSPRHFIELHDKAAQGDVQAKAELNAYAREHGFDNWDEYWQLTMEKLREGLSTIVQTTTIGIRNFEININSLWDKLRSDLQTIAEHAEQDPAYRALQKRSEEPAILADPVLSVAMDYLEDIDIGELLKKIREKQGNPSPILIAPIVHTLPLKLNELQEAAIAWVQRDGLTRDMTEFLSEWSNQNRGYFSTYQLKRALQQLGKMGVIEKGPNKRWRMKTNP